jgi:hypothetical protein
LKNQTAAAIQIANAASETMINITLPVNILATLSYNSSVLRIFHLKFLLKIQTIIAKPPAEINTNQIKLNHFAKLRHKEIECTEKFK